MQLHLDETDVADACCVFVAARHRCIPERVKVDLFYEPGFGFGADAKAGFQKDRLNEQDMIDGIALFLSEYHNFRPEDLDISLQYPDQARIEAYVVLRSS